MASFTITEVLYLYDEREIIMKILVVSHTECTDYAAEELKKYIVGMSDGKILPEIIHNADAKKADDGEIVLGLLSELLLSEEGLDDPMLDDIIDVNVDKLTGYISGSNPRSVLMGVYRYCESAGVRYLRPGADGDYIPSADIMNHSFSMRKKADYPFRGECSEGAISYEHMRDTVYWLPKIGMNLYMIEGLVPYTYMHKWYGHVYNTKLRTPGQVTDYEMLKRYISRLERDIKRAGLQLHTIGHGWMFEKLGIHDSDDKSEKDGIAALTDEQKSVLALVNGKRDLCYGNTFFTHFCYSNPKARRLLVDFMVEYVESKPHVDFIHMWLADSINNQCECDECKKREPSDWYVMMLNELDEELTKRGSEAKIVFIMYNDTVRPPKEFKLNNPRRFILLSAIGMFYEDGYKNEECPEELPPYERNNYSQFSAPMRMKCYRDWKSLCGGIKSFIYEYRYYTDMYCDISQMRVSGETSRDMKALSDISFDGCISDQTPRMFLPTSLPLTTMGKTLFDVNTDFERLKDDYFLSAFGADGELVKEFLDKLSVLLSPSNFRVGGKGGREEDGVGFIESRLRPWVNNPEVAERADNIPSLLDEFIPIIRKNLSSASDPSQRLSWIYLEHFVPICRYHGEILKAGGNGDLEKAKSIFAELRDYVSEHELEFHNAFDLFLYLRAVAQKIGVKMPKYYD